MTSVRLCHSDEIPEPGGKGFNVDGTALVAIKMRGRIYLYRNACPHMGIPLEWVEDQFLDSSKSLIQCANHGALFLPESGRCVTGPCSGQTLTSVVFDLVDGYITLKR